MNNFTEFYSTETPDFLFTDGSSNATQVNLRQIPHGRGRPESGSSTFGNGIVLLTISCLAVPGNLLVLVIVGKGMKKFTSSSSTSGRGDHVTRP